MGHFPFVSLKDLPFEPHLVSDTYRALPIIYFSQCSYEWVTDYLEMMQIFLPLCAVYGINILQRTINNNQATSRARAITRMSINSFMMKSSPIIWTTVFFPWSPKLHGKPNQNRRSLYSCTWNHHHPNQKLGNLLLYKVAWPSKMAPN